MAKKVLKNTAHPPAGVGKCPYDLLWNRLLLVNQKIVPDFNDATWKVFVELKDSPAHIEIPERIRKLCGELVPKHVRLLVNAGKLFFEKSRRRFGDDDEVTLRDCVTRFVQSWIKAQRKLIGVYVEEHFLGDSSVDPDLLLGTKHLVDVLFAALDIGIAELRSDLGKNPRQTEQWRFPTPEGATWEDFTMKFTDSHTLQIRIDKKSWPKTFYQMGFSKGSPARPNMQWELLEKIVDQGGIARSSVETVRPKKRLNDEDIYGLSETWKSGHIEARMKTRKSNLSKALMKYFGLDDDPLPFKQGVGWVPRFKIDSQN